MLSYLSVKNFALIENCEINFSNHLNIISGETGVGKSIIIQALAILLGARASTDHIRSGMKEAVLNAILIVENQVELLAGLTEKGILIDNNEIILRRILTAEGKSKSFINSTPVTTKELSLISSHLFDFHGQHDGISLLKKQTHLNYLDNYLCLGPETEKLAHIYTEIQKLENELQLFHLNEKDKAKKIELLQFEISEIEAIDFKKGEDIQLKQQIKVMENHEKLMTLLQESHNIFSGENGLQLQLKRVKNLLEQITGLDPGYQELADDLTDVYFKSSEIGSEVNSKLSLLEYDANRLDELIGRSEEIEKIKRKYGDQHEKIVQYLNDAARELKQIQFSEEKKQALETELKKVITRYTEAALQISKQRKQGSLDLEKKVKQELEQLAMNNVEFQICIQQENSSTDSIRVEGKNVKYTARGIDQVEFLISPNKGEPLKSLTRIASGGELSRIILALKKVLAQNDIINTMIFDEIDAGIGGKAALSVSRSLKKLSIAKQIICITHLPQIAAASDYHFLIDKVISNNRTTSKIICLEDEDKIKEISRMLSGQTTAVSLNHARELIHSIQFASNSHS